MKNEEYDPISERIIQNCMHKAQVFSKMNLEAKLEYVDNEIRFNKATGFRSPILKKIRKQILKEIEKQQPNQ